MMEAEMDEKKRKQAFGAAFLPYPESDIRLIWLETGKVHPIAQKRMRMMRYRGIRISLDEIFELEDKQNCRCAICGGRGTFLLAVDHHHDNGLVRGLLCSSCNLMLGNANDDVEILKSAIAYLDGFEGRKNDYDCGF